MILHIDATGPKVKLDLSGQKIEFEAKDKQGRQQILIRIDELLKANNVNPKALNKIVINPGPGSFTGTRISVVIANILSQSLQVPIETNTGKTARIIEPFYDRPANITPPKP